FFISSSDALGDTPKTSYGFLLILIHPHFSVVLFLSFGIYSRHHHIIYSAKCLYPECREVSQTAWYTRQSSYTAFPCTVHGNPVPRRWTSKDYNFLLSGLFPGRHKHP